MKVIIAPDSFKETLSALDVAAALAAGVLEACPDAQVDLCPMADGGEGTVSAMVAATGGKTLTADVYDPLGAPIRAHFGLLGTPDVAVLPGALGLSGSVQRFEGEGGDVVGGEHLTAVIEMAAASGLGLVPPDRRDPLRTTTFGTGQLILTALDAGATGIIMGIGGSATVDGGCGCAQALGVTFVGRDGEACVCGLAGGGLADITDFDLGGRDPRIEETSIRVACDVTNPLTGPNGAAAVYGPQKGATPESVPVLETGLSRLAELIRRKLGRDLADMPGAGAAGGLGAGLVAFAGATLEKGIDIIAEAVRLPRRLHGADLCLTGEGRLDGQSASGKTACGVAGAARIAGVPVVCVPGQVATDAPLESFDAVRPLVADEVTERLALQQPKTFLKRRALEATREFLKAKG